MICNAIAIAKFNELIAIFRIFLTKTHWQFHKKELYLPYVDALQDEREGTNNSKSSIFVQSHQSLQPSNTVFIAIKSFN